jgi:hypothetical protein
MNQSQDLKQHSWLRQNENTLFPLQFTGTTFAKKIIVVQINCCT